MSEGSGRPVRVAFVTDALPERNGVGAYYCDLIDQLPASEFDCLLLGPDGPVKPWLKLPLPGDGTQSLVVPSLPKFANSLRDHRPDVLVCATPGPFGLAGARWAGRINARLLVGFHTDYAAVTDIYKFALLRFLSRRYCRAVDRWMFRRAEQVLCNSDPMIQLAQRRGARKTTSIGTLLPADVLNSPPPAAPTGLGRILFAGRLAPEKRLEQVIEAAQHLPELQFTIAGEGPLREMVEQAASELHNLDYVGWLSRPELVAQIDAADALVLPSELESFGTVALEAMARQRLVFVTDTCGIAGWPKLARHLGVFDRDTPLHEVLAAASGEVASVRRRMAEQAGLAARELNTQSLASWKDLLRASGENL